MKLEEKRKDKKKTILITLGVLLTICIVTSISYAYWQITKVQENNNKLVSGCFDIKLEGGKAINLENAYPIEDTEGAKLTPYTFTITNICDLLASYTVNLEMLEGTTMASKYIKVMMNKEEIQNLANLETTGTIIKNSIESRKLVSGILGAGDSEEYTLRLWMDGDITIEDKEAMNKQLLSKIVVSASPSSYNPVDNGITLLKDAILATEYQTTNVNIAKERIANKQAVDFSKTAPIIDWQENHATSTSIVTYTMPDSSLVNSGIEGTENLTAENILPFVGDGYTFDKESGMYLLKNYKKIDPITLNYEDNDYYIMNNEIDLQGSNVGTQCSINEFVLYKIKTITKKEGTRQGSNGITYKTTNYEIEGYRYNQIEVENDKSDKGIYQMEDDYGTSYYYRGSVLNNNVYFAGFFWKILRINGNGSIRLIYNGKNVNAKGKDATIGTSKFNLLKSDPAYVGYMYGNTLNSSYEETTANENESEMKKYLDKWYKENIEDKNYTKYISDEIFCNDRSIHSGSGYKNNDYTYYNGNNRMKNFSPLLKCINKNDSFTIDNSKGNGKLKYAIGLITLDEMMLAGARYERLNRLSYISNEYNTASMTPRLFFSYNDSSILVAFEGSGRLREYKANSNLYIRPIINLKADTEISSGIGTSNEPFIVK